MNKAHLSVLLIPLVVLIVGLFALAYFGVWDWSTKINTGQAFEIIVLTVLVMATIFYAQRTSSIADATKEQADASVKMAKESREQRYSGSLPLLVPAIVPTLRELAANEFVAYEGLVSGKGIKVMWRNAGKGVAINSQFSFWTALKPSGKVGFFPPQELGALEVGGQKEVDYSEMLGDQQLRDVPEGYRPHLLAEYKDIYERNITTVQEFRVDEENRGTSLGELYFTVNGRRLGEEVAEND